MHKLHLALFLVVPISSALHGCAATETAEEAALRIALEQEVEEFNNNRYALLDSYQTGETTIQDIIADGWITENEGGGWEFADENPEHVRVMVMVLESTGDRFAISSGYLPHRATGTKWASPPGMLNMRYSGSSAISVTNQEIVAVSDPRGARLWSTSYGLIFRDGVLIQKK
ncbi:MAG: hypothetical protein ACI841_003317 [Planctomycetota bacterium]|jgi:hypothetical protein